MAMLTAIMEILARSLFGTELHFENKVFVG